MQQAARNPEFGVGHLEKWAEMLQILKDIAANRMPSVADLLKQASQAPRRPSESNSNKTAMTGEVRSLAPGKPGTVKPATQKRQAAESRSRRPGIDAELAARQEDRQTGASEARANRSPGWAW